MSIFGKKLSNRVNFRLFSVISFLILFIVSIPISINLVSKNQDTRSKANEISSYKIKFKFSIAEIKDSKKCFAKSNVLTVDILNPVSKSSQIGSTVNFYPIEGQFNSKGYQVFETEEIILNSSFNLVNNFNYLKIKGVSSLKTVLCINKQKNKISKNSDCNINLSEDKIYDFSEYPLIIGDINDDNMVNTVDFSYVKNKLNADFNVSCNEKTDVNFDGVVNTVDLALIKKNIFINGEDISELDKPLSPTKNPTSVPTIAPTITQTVTPTKKPTDVPTIAPTSSVATKILFVGNSKTYRPTIAYQSIADIFLNMAKNGGYSVEVTKAAIDGSTLANTANVKQSVITSKAFDIVVLQEQTGTIEKADTSTFLNGAEKIRKLVTSKNSNVRLFLRTSWGLKANLGTNIQTRMYANVDTVASSINATIIPDGKTFDASLKTYPSINMYSDSTHQSKEGAYLVSACIYKIVFGSDPRQLSYYGYVDESTAKKMQEIANDTCK